MNFREPREYVNELQKDAELLPAHHTLAIAIEERDNLWVLPSTGTGLVAELSALMTNGGIPLGLIRISPAEVELTRTSATIQIRCGYRCFRECVFRTDKNKILLNETIRLAHDSMKNFRILNNRKYVILVSDNNPATRYGAYFELAILITTRDDLIPAGKKSGNPAGPPPADRE